MEPRFWKETLQKANVAFAPALTLAELRQAEQVHAFTFPEDLAELLRFALPVSRGWPDWREPRSPSIAAALAWPLEGILFDIEQNQFWLDEWGERPSLLEDAFAVAKDRVATAPTLIPVAGHRYLPAQPSERGNPVLSVYQTDVIYYGRDLAEYFENEFSYYFRGPGSKHRVTSPIKRIEFWSSIIEDNVLPAPRI